MSAARNNFPKLHNAAWPGVVGKGSPDAEPFIELDTMLDLTAAAEVDGVKFDGVDLFLFDPHVSIDSTDDDLKRLAERVTKRMFLRSGMFLRIHSALSRSSPSCRSSVCWKRARKSAG